MLSFFGLAFLIYIVLVYLFSYFSFFDPEYFLFFSSTALFCMLSYFFNSFVESAIKTKYDIQLSRLVALTLQLEILDKFVSDFYTHFNFNDFLSILDAKVDELDFSISLYFNDDETFDTLVESLYTIILNQNFVLSLNFINFSDLLVYNEVYESLILMLIQDPWRWKRRARINKSFSFGKYFKTSKKYPAVAWPIKPEDYKIPREAYFDL